MKISVVIPVFNASKTLKKVLESVVTQTWPVYEIVLINDCSSDNTDAIILEFKNIYKKFKFTYIVLKENRGVSYCRNIGWNAALGDYIAFIDSDDYWNKHKIEFMQKCILKELPELIGHKYNESYIGIQDEKEFNIKNLSKVKFLKLMLRNKFQTSCVLIKASINERFDTTMSHSEDYELFLRITVKNYNVQFLNEELTYLGRPQLSKGGLSEKKMKMRLGEIKAYNKSLSEKRLLILFPFFILYSLFKSLLKIYK